MFVTGIAVLWAGDGGGRPATGCWSTRASSPTTCATSRSPTRIAIGAAFLPVDPVWLKWIVAAVLVGIYAWYVRGHSARRRRTTRRGARAAALPPAGPAGRARTRTRRACGSSTLQVLDGARADRRRGAVSSSGPCRTCRRSSASTRPCSRWSSRRSPPSCPRSSTRSSGSARARTPSRWATSPARWSSSRPSRRSSRSCSRPTPGRRPRARTSSSRRPASPSCRRRSSSSRWPAAACSTAGCCWPAARFYVAYLVLVVGVVTRRHRRRLPGGRLIYSGDRYEGARSMLTEKSDAKRRHAERRTVRPSRPDPGLARRPDLLLRGRLGPDARRQGQHHDPRVHVRDRHVRGHPRPTGTPTRAAVRAQDRASTWSASASRAGSC